MFDLAAPAKDPGRLVRVALPDVPFALRERCARLLIDEASRRCDVSAAIEIRRALLFPSEETYLLPEHAVVEALGAVPNGGTRRYIEVEFDGMALTVPDGRDA